MWREILDTVLDVCGALDIMFALAYGITSLIEWIRNRRSR